MPNYHFCLERNGEFIADPKGVFLQDDAAALETAATVVKEFRNKNGSDWRGWRLEIYNGAGRKVGTIPL